MLEKDTHLETKYNRSEIYTNSGSAHWDEKENECVQGIMYISSV